MPGDSIEDLREETRLLIISIEDINLEFENTLPSDIKTHLENIKKAAQDVLSSLTNKSP